MNFTSKPQNKLNYCNLSKTHRYWAMCSITGEALICTNVSVNGKPIIILLVLHFTHLLRVDGSQTIILLPYNLQVEAIRIGMFWLDISRAHWFLLILELLSFSFSTHWVVLKWRPEWWVVDGDDHTRELGELSIDSSLTTFRSWRIEAFSSPFGKVQRQCHPKASTPWK